MTSGSTPCDGLAFRWPWRPYQKRVLDAVEAHLGDRRLHVVAAPGAGKTILGLEVFRLLGRPALVLAPTRTIRDQWIRRLEDFLPESARGAPPDWTSRSLDAPGYLTALTYQALHTRYREAQASDPEDSTDAVNVLDEVPSGAELAGVAAGMRSRGVRTLIFDEAHHLRAEWWKALQQLVDAIEGQGGRRLTIVALTATPPYDVVGSEWRRYEKLCGSIDEEISVPELVRSGTLCPHQDLVWAVEPTADERLGIHEYDHAVATVTSELLQDATLLDAVRAHRWLRPEAEGQPDPIEVLDDAELAISLLSFLWWAGTDEGELPTGLLDLLDCTARDLPPMDRRRWQVLVHAYLFKPGWPEDDDAVASHREKLRRRLRSMHLLHRRELRLERSREVEADLAMTPAKIEACARIHRLERATRGPALRQVVLTDFIREAESSRLGAWPVFRKLVESTLDAAGEPLDDLALLTGRIVALHGNLLPALVKKLGPRAAGLRTRALESPTPALTRFVLLDLPGGRSALVRPLTALLKDGALRVVVGTRALLGEGWDAPVVNSLVLASYVGSYILTNQMRGRAIRLDPRQPHKASAVWHLVALDPASETGLKDLAQLRRRFETFVGLAESKARIEAGLDRLALPSVVEGPERWNRLAEERLRGAPEWGRRWREAIDAGQEGRVLPQVETSSLPSVRPFQFANTIRYLLYSAGSLFLTGVLWRLRGAGFVESSEGLLWLLLAAALTGFVWALPKLLRALRVALRHVPVEGTLREIALTIRDALHQTDLIQTSRQRLIVEAEPLGSGQWAVSMKGGTFYESSLFADCLAEVLGPIENPRYIVTRRGLGLWTSKLDYHAVPAVLGTRKDRATTLAGIWNRRVAPAELIYTRSREGRRELLRARARALSGQFTDPVRRRDRWR